MLLSFGDMPAFDKVSFLLDDHTGAGAIELAGARAPKFLIAGARGGTTHLLGHP